MTAKPADIFLWHALEIFLMIGALLGVAAALLLIFKPDLLGRINHVANRWISTRRISRVMDRSIGVEHWFYQHHRAAGIAVVLGAIYIFVYFGTLYDKTPVMLHWNGRIAPGLLDGLLDGLVLVLLVGAAVALMVGLFLWLRPSLLRGIEEEANLWLSTRRAVRMLDIPRDQVDRFVARHAQRVGWLLLLGSIYLFFALFRLLE